ncbi:dna-binding protein hexbp [Stemphylium lycopersici]|nr:dna-binding protein hexbp [Stemphylium lycopersici]
MGEHIDTRRIRSSTPPELRDYFRDLLKNASVESITQKLLRAVDVGSIPPVSFAPWLGVSNSHTPVREGLIQDKSALIRRLSIKQLRKLLSSSHWRETWDGLRGTVGLLSIFENLSGLEVHEACKAIGRSARGRDLVEKRITFTELYRGLHPEYFPDAPWKTEDDRALGKAYGLLIPTCSEEVMERILEDDSKALVEGARQKDLLIYHPAIMQKMAIQRLGSEESPPDGDIVLKGLLHQFPAATSNTRGFSESMSFSMKLLARLSESDGFAVDNVFFVNKLVGPLLRRAVRKRADWGTIKQIVDTTMIYLEKHPDVANEITSMDGDILHQVALCWSRKPTFFETSLKRLCSYPISGILNKDSLEGWESLGRGIAKRRFYPLLRLCYREATSLDLNLDVDLKKVKGSLHNWGLINMAPEDALSLFIRLRRLRGDKDLVQPGFHHFVTSPTPTYGDTSGDPDLYHIWLLWLNNKESEARNIAVPHVENQRNKAVSASQPEQRAFYSNAALYAAIASGSLELFGQTLEWVKRFIRDPLVFREVYTQWYPDEAERLLSGIPATLVESFTLLELRQRVEQANSILASIFDTACEALGEPSFSLRDWSGAFGLFHSVVKKRMELTPALKRVLKVSDAELYNSLWPSTISTIIAIEGKANEEAHARLEANLLRGIIAHHYSATLKLEYTDISTYSFIDGLAQARDDLWSRLRPRVHPSVTVLPEPFPRGLPVQYLASPWELNVADLETHTPYLASRVHKVLFPNPTQALQRAPLTAEFRKTTGMFLDSYQHAFRMFIPNTCKGEERDARFKQVWNYAANELSRGRMTEDEAVRFWVDRIPEELRFLLPKGARNYRIKPWPLLPTTDESTEIHEWNPFTSGRSDLPSRELQPTYIDLSLAVSDNSAYNPTIHSNFKIDLPKVPAQIDEPSSIWDSTRSIGEGGVLSALMYLDARYTTNNDRLLASPFPSEDDIRYPSTYLDEEFLSHDGLDPLTAAKSIRGHLQAIPSKLLFQLTKDVFQALDATSEASSSYNVLHETAMQLIIRLGESDRPALAKKLVIDTTLSRPNSSSWHRSLLKRKFLRRLPGPETRSCVRLLADGILQTLQDKKVTRENSEHPISDGKTKEKPHTKVTTIKLLVQLLGEKDLIGIEYAFSVLSAVSQTKCHVDVRLSIVKALLALHQSNSSIPPDKILSLLEPAIPVAGALDERNPTTEPMWRTYEEEISLPHVQAGIEGLENDSPILTTVIWHLRHAKMSREKLQPLVNRIISPLLKELEDQTKRWSLLFLRKYGGDLGHGRAVFLPPIPRDLSVMHTLLLMGDARLLCLPRTVLVHYVAYVNFNVAPPKPIRELNERLQGNPVLNSRAEVKTWLHLYGRGLEVLNPHKVVHLVSILEHADDISHENAITPKVVQEQFLELFTAVVWNDGPEYTNLDKSVCRKILNGESLTQPWWGSRGRPILEAMIAYVNTIRTREWERDPNRKPATLPDTFPWRLLLLDYPWPSREDAEADSDRKCKIFAYQLGSMVEELSGMPTYHHALSHLTAYLTIKTNASVASSKASKQIGRQSMSYARHDVLEDALVNNRVLTAVYIGDITKTTLSWLTTPELLKVEVASVLIEAAFGRPVRQHTVLDEHIKGKLAPHIEEKLDRMIGTWKACENEGVRRNGLVIESKYLVALRNPYPQRTWALPSFSPFYRSLFRNGAGSPSASFPSCSSAPQYTFGNPSDDYYNSSFLIAMVLWFLEFGILAPETGSGAPAYTGNPGSIDVGKTTLNETESQWERLHWVASLMVPSHRGIGWNWQVKGVPDDPMKDATKPKFMRSHAMKMLGSYVRSVCMLMLLGWASAMEKRMASYHDARLQNLLTNALIGWSGATWVWDRLNFAYSSMAFLSVFSGMSATWQWPPLMGRLRDAWSVRQMWSVVYHQIMRKMVSQPAIRVVRLLGIPKGSLASRYGQLYLSFAFSCLVHEYQMFMVTRKDMGEFVFFMSQPIAITVEDFAQYLWRRLRSRAAGSNMSDPASSTYVGYIWVFLWFSIILPVYVKGCRDVGIMRDLFLRGWPFDTGFRLANSNFW